MLKMERKMELINSIDIEYHADDYGLFPVQSQRILDCRENGRLNGVSVMPNHPRLEHFLEQLRPYRENMAITVHLNLIEGGSLCPREAIPALTDPAGKLQVSFGKFLIRSYLPGRADLRQQLKAELRAQILAVKAHMEPGAPLRLDSHAHYHMIPVVFDAMMDVIRDENLNVSYIRIPREYPGLYLRHWNQLTDFSAVNLLKVGILNLLAYRNEKKHGDFLEKCEKKVFLGVMLSGRMYLENVLPILPEACALARRRNCGLEILAHPGGVYEPGDIAQLTNRADVEFLTSDRRKKEASLFFGKM